VCVIIDKREHIDSYANPWHPYHFCLSALLDRYCGWLNHYNAVGDVMAESRGREEDLRLKQAYRTVHGSGTWQFGRDHHQRALTSGEIKMQPKRANIAGLQLADVLAYPVRQACLVERGAVGDPGQVFGKRVADAVASKLNRREDTGEVWGYGKVWLPRK
jgi:hypothetical protein